MMAAPVRYLALRAAALGANTKTAILIFGDMALVPLAVLFACSLAPTGIGFAAFWPAMPGLMILTGALSYRLGPAQTRLRDFDTRTARQTALIGLCLGLASWMIWGARMQAPSPLLIGIGFCLGAILMRIALREGLVALYHVARTTRPALIYGAGAAGRQVAAILARSDKVHAVGFLEDDPGLQGRRVVGLPVHAATRIEKVAKLRGTDLIYLAMPSAPLPRRIAIARRLEARGFEVRAAPLASIAADTGPDAARQLLARRQIAVDHLRLSLSYAGRSVLITGAGGSIGRELCRQVIDCAPSRLVLFDLSEAALFEVERLLAPVSGGVEVVAVLGSVTDAALVRAILAENRIDVVLHAAAYKHVALVEANPLAGLFNNVLGTEVLARAAAAAGVDRFILISTDKAVAPVGAMGATKRLAELAVHRVAVAAGATRFAAVRFGNVLGSSGSVVPIFRAQIAAGGPVTVTDAAATRYYMSVEDAVRLVLVAGAITDGGEIFVLDMGAPISVGTLARQMIADAGLRLRDAQHPDGDIEVRTTGLRHGERLHEIDMTLGASPSGAHPLILKAVPAPLPEAQIARYMAEASRAVANTDREAAKTLIAAMLDESRGSDAASVAPASRAIAATRRTAATS